MKPPCKDCPDRYIACSDHCRKPDYLKWRQRQETIRKNREADNALWAYTAKEI